MARLASSMESPTAIYCDLSRVIRVKDIEVSDKLFDAIREGDSANVLQLIANDVKFDLNHYDKASGLTPLALAAKEGKSEIIHILVKVGGELDQPDFWGQTALQYTAMRGHLAAAKKIIDLGAALDWTYKKSGLTALHLACGKGQTDVAALLLKNGSKVNARVRNGVCALHCGIASGKKEVVDLLLSHGAKTNFSDNKTNRTPLFNAIEAGDLCIIEALVKHGAKLNHCDDFGMTPLCVACIRNCTTVAKYIVKCGANVNIPDSKMNLPLHYTARNGNYELTKLLIEKGSGIDNLNKYSESPLHMAVRNAHVDIVRKLVQQKCDVNICGPPDNATALHIAVHVASDVETAWEIIQLLLEGGCDLNARAFSLDETPLHRALEIGKSQIALLLLQCGADPNIECPHEITVLQKACRKGFLDIIDMVIHSGVDWEQEKWLYVDIHNSGINKELLLDYEEGDIPMALIDNIDLFFYIMEVKNTVPKLTRVSRSTVRKAMGSRVSIGVQGLVFPPTLKDFLMLRVV